MNIKMEQFIYITKIRHIATGNTFIKLGYTNDMVRRCNELINHNTQFEFEDWQLYKQYNKNTGYRAIENKIHKQNRDYCANLTKEVMPDGNTECYPAHYENWFIAELSRYNFDRIF